jgi:hypothetical protein
VEVISLGVAWDLRTTEAMGEQVDGGVLSWPLR